MIHTTTDKAEFETPKGAGYSEEYGLDIGLETKQLVTESLFFEDIQYRDVREQWNYKSPYYSTNATWKYLKMGIYVYDATRIGTITYEPESV